MVSYHSFLNTSPFPCQSPFLRHHGAANHLPPVTWPAIEPTSADRLYDWHDGLYQPLGFPWAYARVVVVFDNLIAKDKTLIRPIEKLNKHGRHRPGGSLIINREVAIVDWKAREGPCLSGYHITLILVKLFLFRAFRRGFQFLRCARWLLARQSDWTGWLRHCPLGTPQGDTQRLRHQIHGHQLNA